MTIAADYVVVGSGLTGSVVARQLADAGREVVVLERRQGLGGNVVDAIHAPSGIRFNLWGPHYFRTSSDRIWAYATRFADFFPYEARVVASIDGEIVPWPPQREYIERIAGKDWRPEFTHKPENLEQAALSLMPRVIYTKMVENYSFKQWGKPCRKLSASLCKRFDVRDGETRLTPNAKYQGIPRDGYTAWMTRMLEGIPIRLGFDYCTRREEVQARRRLIFTGPIDEYFGFRLGRLAYRSQRRWNYYRRSDKLILPAAQVNNPQREGGPHIRSIEWKQMMPPGMQTRGSLVTTETPYSPTNPDEYEYPFPDEENARLYGEYRKLAAKEPGVAFAGRLGKYQYADMDQSIAAALVIADKMLGNQQLKTEE